jgi:hypothetical protein
VTSLDRPTQTTPQQIARLIGTPARRSPALAGGGGSTPGVATFPRQNGCWSASPSSPSWGSRREPCCRAGQQVWARLRPEGRWGRGAESWALDSPLLLGLVGPSAVEGMRETTWRRLCASHSRSHHFTRNEANGAA